MSPHTHRWNSLVEWLLSQNLTATRVKSIKDAKSGFIVYEKHVGFCKAAKEFVSVVTGTPAESVFVIMKEQVVQQGCRALPGQAPPGYCEDQLQQWLESIEEEEIET